MSLFEDWYLTYFQEFIDIEDDLVKDNVGEYLDVRVALMHKAFLAGQILSQGRNTLDANTAFEMIENPPEANEKLIELLRLK